MRSDEDNWAVEMPDRALVLVGCSGSKLEIPAPAREFYTGGLFWASVAWAESWSFRWNVLSALHGLIPPDRVVSYYDVTLSGDSDEQRLDLLRSQLPDDVETIIVLAGATYVEEVRQAWPDLFLWAPLQELSQRGLGHYKRWLIRNSRLQRRAGDPADE
jgi:hypothetical protein